MKKSIQDKNIVAIYNPHTRDLEIHFLDYGVIETHTFEDYSEWVWISHPVFEDQILAIQLDYDETSQLIIYYEYLNEEGGTDNCVFSDCDSWHSGGGRKSSNIFICDTDMEFEMARRLVPQLEFYPKVHEIKLKD